MGLNEEMEGWSMQVFGENFPCGGGNHCRRPEGGICLLCPNHSKEASVGVAERARWRMLGEKSER